MKKIKTNVLRLLDQARISYFIREFDYDQNDHPINIRSDVELNDNQIFKTLVLKGNLGYLVCCIPVCNEIDLKLLASQSGQKYVEMIPQKELLPLSGYVHGGCSPIGMKKKFPTYIQKDILNYDLIGVSAGKRGISVILKPQDLIDYVEGHLVDVKRKL